MNETTAIPMDDPLPFFVVPPGETDVMFIVVGIALAAIVVCLGVLSLTIRGWPDRLAEGANKSQLQLVAILGLISLLTFNDYLWLATLVLAVVRFPDIVTPLREIAESVKVRRHDGAGD